MTNAVPGKGKTALSLKINLDSVIVTQNISVNQESRISELSNCISSHQLTKSLECLEQCGFSGDTAIFILVLANLQGLEVGA